MAKEQPNRQFDWGPPVQSGDSANEWLIYIVIIAVLAVGTWFLVDINKQKYSRAENKSSSLVAVDNSLDSVVPGKDYVEAPEALPEKSSEITEITIKYGPEGIEKADSASSSNTSDKSYFVQIGAFGDENSANEIYGLLKKEGIESTLLRPDEQFEIFRLVVGPFATEEMAEKKAEQLNAIDFPCFVVEAM